MSKLIFNSSLSLPRQVAEAIRRQIREQSLKPGDPLASYRQLTKEFSISLMTAKKAMDLLDHEGTIISIHGKGCFVKDPDAAPGPNLTQIGMVFFGTNQLFFSSDYAQEIFQGIMLRSEQIKADVRFFSIKKDGPIDPLEIEKSGVDGVILVGIANEAYLQKYVDFGIPTVVADFRSETIPLDYVVCDNRAGTAEVVKHIAGLGHTRIAYVDGWSTDTVSGPDDDPMIETSDVIERRQAYQQTMAELKLKKESSVFCAFDGSQNEDNAAIGQRIALAPDPPTAVVAYDSNTARALISGMTDAGRSIPGDITVAAAAGAASSDAGGLTLTYSRFGFVDMGRTAVDVLKDRCGARKRTRPEVHLIGSKLVKGTSAAAPH